MGNSLLVSAAAAITTVLASIPVGILIVRYPSRLGFLLERISYLGFALPGIVIGLTLVFFAVNFFIALYQTIVLLVFGYLVLFLPVALGVLRTSLRQINPRIEEAARTLQSSPVKLLTTIIFPLVRPGILGGLALVFLLTMKELPATLILAPIGFGTLATSVWAASSEAFFARAAVPALLLILASSVPLAFLTLRERSDQR